MFTTRLVSFGITAGFIESKGRVLLPIMANYVQEVYGRQYNNSNISCSTSTINIIQLKFAEHGSLKIFLQIWVAGCYNNQMVNSSCDVN